MPELPEVESTVLRVEPALVHNSVEDIWVGWKNSLQNETRASFLKKIRKSKIIQVQRRAKYIWLTFENSQHLFIHLRMSGNLLVKPAHYETHCHDRIIATLSNAQKLVFRDTRKFGRWRLVSDTEEITGKLGIEPLERKFSARTLRELLRRRKGAIKPLLLNQSVVAGLGNIYVDEVLWKSRILPTRIASTLTSEECSELVSAIKETLREAIRLHGTDFGDKVVTEGGSYQPLAYGRQGQACFRCQQQIKRAVIAQRSSFYCGNCQQ